MGMEQVAGMNNLVNEQKVCKHNYMPGTFSPSSVSQALRGLGSDLLSFQIFPLPLLSKVSNSTSRD